MNHNECIACHLKSERWKRNWSQALVCSNLNISIRTLSRAENGKGISKTTLKKLCSLYQIPISQMYMDVDMKDIEAILPEIISSKKSYSLADIISCCMAVNQRTVKNISKIVVA